MLPVFFFAVICSASALPFTEPVKYDLDGVEGIAYEIPEYEDPQLAIFQAQAKGVLPVLTIADVAKDAKNSSGQKDTPVSKENDDEKKLLSDIIQNLHHAYAKLDGGYEIFDNIDEEIQNLQKLKYQLRYSFVPFDSVDSIDSNFSLTPAVLSPDSSDEPDVETDAESTQTPKVKTIKKLRIKLRCPLLSIRSSIPQSVRFTAVTDEPDVKNDAEKIKISLEDKEKSAFPKKCIVESTTLS